MLGMKIKLLQGKQIQHSFVYHFVIFIPGAFVQSSDFFYVNVFLIRASIDMMHANKCVNMIIYKVRTSTDKVNVMLTESWFCLMTLG